MRPHHRPCTLAIDIQIPHEKQFLRLRNLLFVGSVNRPRQPILSSVRQFNGMIEILGLSHRQHRTKHFFLKQTRVNRNIGNDRRLQIIPIARRLATTRHQPAFLLSNLDVIQNRFLRALADHRPHRMIEASRIANRQRRRLRSQLLNELVIDGLVDNGA